MERTSQLVRRYPKGGFYALVELISLGGFALVVGPKLLRGGSMVALDALILFPILVLGVTAAGVFCVAAIGGSDGLRDLRRRLFRWRVGWRWYLLATLIPPVAILGVLGVLAAFVSRDFQPGFFGLGIAFGLFPGIFEEIGWSGYLVEMILRGRDPFRGAILLGLLWAFWHLPVVNFLGAASPDGAYWP